LSALSDNARRQLHISQLEQHLGSMLNSMSLDGESLTDAIRELIDEKIRLELEVIIPRLKVGGRDPLKHDQEVTFERPLHWGKR